MKAFLHQVGLSLRLNARNRMAMAYGYLFPLIFLVAFWAIYRHDKVPLALHLGELLTVTILGGACFGLPTTMVSERERGVWRRYRLTPAPAWAFVASTLAARYVLLLTAALMQVALALAVGMPLPADPLGLLVAFTCASLAFMGLGMVIAMVADNVPAVQALGQCVFLPMLMIGGVAVRLDSLPGWAQHLSAFFPGRYAVQAIQATVTGHGLGRAGFELAALLAIGLAGGAAAARMFRWAPADRLLPRRGRGWLLLALGMWVAVGLAAEGLGRVTAPDPVPPPPLKVEDYTRPAAPAPRVPVPEVEASPAEAATPEPAAAPAPRTWRDVTPADFKNVTYERLPPDTGVISPVAPAGEEVDPVVADQLQEVRKALVDWPPARVADPVQKTRNLLYVAAVPDLLQMEPIERHLPALVLERLQFDIPEGELKQALYWVATHPDEGDDSAARQLAALGLPAVQGPTRTARERVMIYAFKLLGRLDGDIPF